MRFQIVPDYDLDLMKPDQELAEFASCAMAQAGSPFGDGRAAERIVNILLAKI